jgi:long-chain-fatty-acid---luciferin-component ligase
MNNMNVMNDVKAMLEYGIGDEIFKSDIYYQDENKIRAKRFEFVSNAFSYHYRLNPKYRELCQKVKITPEDIKTEADLAKIAVIPIDCFKKREVRESLLTPAQNKVDKFLMKVESSGTSGIASVGYRNPNTAVGTALTMISLYREYLTEVFGGYGMLAIVPNHFIPNLGIMKNIETFQLILDGFHYAIENPKEGINYIKLFSNLEAKKGIMPRHFIGAPFVMLDIMQYIKKNMGGRLELDPGSYVITVGGWKRREGDLCDRNEFNKMINDVFGIPNEHIRDLFAMAESNLFLMECEYQKKHVPPWAYYTIRAFDDINQCEPMGKEGLLCFYDTINTTYPGFVVSGDVGVIHEEGKCQCGRFGQIFEFRRRASGAENRSCALHMDNYMHGNEH